jgi:peptide/nickel transport system permease protein
LNSPTDPVENLVNASGSESGMNAESSASEELRQEVRKKLGLDLPVFYFNLAAYADCDTIYKFQEKSHQENLSEFVRRYGNWDYIQTYYHSVKKLAKLTSSMQLDSSEMTGFSNKTVSNAKNEMMLSSLSLLELNNPDYIQVKFDSISAQNKRYPFISGIDKEVSELISAYNAILENTQTWKNYIPYLQMNGFENQYNIWLFGSEARNRRGVFRGDFGKSYSDNEEVGTKMLEMFPNSFILVMLSIFLSYLISIPLGVYSAYKKGKLFDSISSVIVFMLYSLPSFFVATLLLYRFANPDYFMWFPTSGIKDPSTFDPEWAWYSLDKIKHQAPYFVLPLIAFTYSSFSFTSRIMRGSMIDVLDQDYIRTARAKGLSEKKVILKHALRNSLLPIITMFANVFPAAIGGSVILEYIFGFPGMGRGIFEAIGAIDIPMIVAVFTLTGVLTVTGYLVADILYVLVDPRISYKK